MTTSALMLRFEILRQFGRVILPKYRFKWPQMAWWEDAAFAGYLKKFGEQDGMNADRRWMLGQLMRLIKNVPGNTAECGVYRGAGSYLICRSNAAQDRYRRVHHVFDSFEGLSEPREVDGTHWKKGDLASGEAIVAANLAEFTDVRLYKGWIPSRFSEVDSESFAFAHIDVDIYQPTMDSIRFFYPRLETGGLLVCDDYGFTTCPGATRAIDEFLSDKPEKMLMLCCGGGFLIKGRHTIEYQQMSAG